ncbi:MAG: hypothetical protein ACRC8Y_22590 [Chroococcales cyanobacterium]
MHPIRYFHPGLSASGKGLKIETAYLPVGQESALDRIILAQFVREAIALGLEISQIYPP